MPQSQEDRRLRRTRRLLRRAMLDLLREKRYAALTVQDIIDRADVARSTFYTHYLDKEDLLVGQQGIFAGYGGRSVGREGDTPTVGSALSARRWFEHIQARQPILKVMAGDPARDLALKSLRDVLSRDYQTRLQSIRADETRPPLPTEIIVEYLVSTLLVLIQWWIDHDMPYPPARMDEIFQQLVTSGLFHDQTGHDPIVAG